MKKRPSKRRFDLSDAFCLEFENGERYWPSTMNGAFRLVVRGQGRLNVIGEGEVEASEEELIRGVFGQQKKSRFRSERKLSAPANHLSLKSKKLTAVYINVGGSGVYVRVKSEHLDLSEIPFNMLEPVLEKKGEFLEVLGQSFTLAKER